MDELDELRLKIAKMEGWKQVSENVVCPTRDGSNFEYVSKNWISPDGKYSYPPNWPRDIAAWELVEEVRSRGYPFVIMAIPDNVPDVEDRMGEYEAKIYSEKSYSPMIYVGGVTPPEAICRAWLAWKEAQG